MEKDDYLRLRATGDNIQIAYQYYIEHCKKDCKNQTDFIMYFSTWFGATDAIKTAIEYYDIKFEIMYVTDLKTNQIIRVQ